ncbi:MULTISPECIES: Fic family protein [Mycolicibacterium]|uniref:Fic family protein n=2 Tax=Mycobacteriaceae TaxID=1762 RepID=UPI001CDC8698|nr:Fic/DOC family N-terminal domain-containing protein [Mycolicibacterium fortuitum]MCA4726403.1 Fic family protein [Mycolicibacterium fortuitum]UBV13927.1 Fic family protein [Mycolicibacterium fortuitum]UBV23360.1 Fic family protein [Mycolicibacterium fortuitum]
MDVTMFVNEQSGSLVDIVGSDPSAGEWRHKAFVPAPLLDEMPNLSTPTFLAVSAARAALAALDSTATQLPDPTLLRMPALRREAQSTSALEGTYAPLAQVLTADDEEPTSAELVEILNYVRMANYGFRSVAEGRPISTHLLEDLQGLLMHGTPLADQSGRIRDTQVVIGRRGDAPPDLLPIHAARFIPPPPGDHLTTGLQDLVDWMRRDHTTTIDPVVAAAMSHYQLETLHPFRDGNGRLGRLLIILHLHAAHVLTEPTLTVSPWFEARRTEYYDRLLAVSTDGAWDDFVRFFAVGLRESANATRHQMLELVSVQAELKEVIRASALRADSAHALVDFAVAHSSFTVRNVEAALDVSYGRANKLIGQLMDLGVLDVVDADAYKRRFFAPRVLNVLTAGGAS